MTLQSTPTGPYWHYRVHPQILNDITEYTHRSLLTLQGTPTGPQWHYRVHPQVLTDITGYTHRSSMTLQGTPTGPYWHYRVHLHVLTWYYRVYLQVLTDITGYTFRSLLTSQGTHTGAYWYYILHLQAIPDITIYIYWSLLKHCIYFSELGNGWNLTYLNDQAEYEFIREAQRGLSHDRSYWIGGGYVRANNAFIAGEVVDFTDYRPDRRNNFTYEAINMFQKHWMIYDDWEKFCSI